MNLNQGFQASMVADRRIVDFRQDNEQQWVAELDCGHAQHVRHTPPWQLRPWVLTAEGRAQHLGTELRCRLCEVEGRRSAGECRVRHARPSDVQDWGVLRHALWPAESPDELAAEARTFFVDGDTLVEAVLLAESSDGTLLGFAELSLRPYAEDCRTSPVAFLEGWYVIPAARRQGVGRALVSAAEQWARDRGCHEFASDTELDNSMSAAAHRALGFEDAGAIRCFRKDL
jgi:aminoglycoside 6'-N-acetyltransferase I